MKKSVIIASIILLISSMVVVSCSQPQQTPSNNTPTPDPAPTPTVSLVGTWKFIDKSGGWNHYFFMRFDADGSGSTWEESDESDPWNPRSFTWDYVNTVLYMNYKDGTTQKIEGLQITSNSISVEMSDGYTSYKQTYIKQ